MKLRGRTVPSKWQCSSTFGIDLKNSGAALTGSLAVFLRGSSERLVVLLALRRRGIARLADLLLPVLLPALVVVRRLLERVLVGLLRFVAHDLLEIGTGRLGGVAVDERHGGGPVRRQVGHVLRDVVELERGEERGAR